MKTLAASLALTLATATTAFAGSADNTDAIQRMLDSCQTAESSTRAVIDCSKLIRMSPDSEVRARLLTQRAVHRIALGKHKAAAKDFRFAAELTDDARLDALGDGFTAVASADYDAARDAFEDCTGRKGLAPVAHYGLGLAYSLSGDDGQARESFQQALVLRPGWAPAERGVQSLG